MSMVDTRLLGKPERWNGEDKSWKNSWFVTRAHLMAAPLSLHDLLERAENGGASDSVLCAKLTQDGQTQSTLVLRVGSPGNWACTGRGARVQAKEK